MSIPDFMVKADGFPHAPKDPSAIIRYVWDWSRWLVGVSGEGIDATAITAEDGLTLVGSTTLANNRATQVFAGGTVGQSYKAVCRITTAPSGLVDERTIVIDVVER